jgi:type IV pilus assembly protein PilZ
LSAQNIIVSFFIRRLKMGQREMLRIDAKIAVEFKNFDHFYREYANNLSKGGLFIKTEKALDTQTIVEVNLKLPNLADPLNLVGEVVHTIDAGMAKSNGWNAGMGIHFVDFEDGVQQILEEYIKASVAKKATQLAKDRRSHPRVLKSLRVKFPSLKVLQEDYSQDISSGGMFIQSQTPRPLGEKILIVLVHPDTKEELKLKGKVVRKSQEDPSDPSSISGMGIKFIDIDDKKQKAINIFLGLNFLDNNHLLN